MVLPGVVIGVVFILQKFPIMVQVGFVSLPVELILEILLFSLSDSLPYLNQYCHAASKLATTSFRALYLIGRFDALTPASKRDGIVTRALRYPICTIQVLNAIINHPRCPPLTDVPELPRRLFRPLTPKPAADGRAWSQTDSPLPMLRYLYDSPRIPPPNPNSHDGYALTKAVHANFTRLARFLLHHGASPACKAGLVVRVAIRKKDLAVVRMLIEPDSFDAESRRPGSTKRRRKEDRVEASNWMLEEAVKADARDIVDYFMREKGVAPDIATLRLMDASAILRPHQE